MSAVPLAGDACIIPNTREFFIATADHEEWGHSHTVWGQVGGKLRMDCTCCCYKEQCSTSSCACVKAGCLVTHVALPRLLCHAVRQESHAVPCYTVGIRCPLQALLGLQQNFLAAGAILPILHN
jgi:hypothetical protein